jgi:hypothetical protein
VKDGCQCEGYKNEKYYSLLCQNRVKLSVYQSIVWARI